MGLSGIGFQSFPQPKRDGGLKTGDATAVAGDIGFGKTAYGVLGKMTGTGANLGTATPADIIIGKTFSAGSYLAAAGTGVNAKRFAKGTQTGSFTSGNTYTVSGLAFDPKAVLVMSQNTYFIAFGKAWNGSTYQDVFINNSGGAGAYFQNGAVGTGSFSVYCNTTNSSGFSWIAFEGE